MRFQPNCANYKDHQILIVGHPKICHTYPKWRMAPSWKKDKLLYLSNGFTNFYEILHADAYWPFKP